MNRFWAEMLSELKALRESVDEIRARSARPAEALNEITTREALKIMRCNTNASLSSLAKLFPSIKIRRGVYDRENLKAALNAKSQMSVRQRRMAK